MCFTRWVGLGHWWWLKGKSGPTCWRTGRSEARERVVRIMVGGRSFDSKGGAVAWKGYMGFLPLDYMNPRRWSIRSRGIIQIRRCTYSVQRWLWNFESVIGFDADGVQLPVFFRLLRACASFGGWTGEVRWRETGYEISQALKRLSRTNFGYASVRGVDMIMSENVDDMPRYAKFNLPLSLPIWRFLCIATSSQRRSGTLISPWSNLIGMIGVRKLHICENTERLGLLHPLTSNE